VRRFARHRAAMVGLVVLGVIAVAAIAAPLLTPYDPARIDLSQVKAPPSAEHWLGGDQSGRDVFSRLLYGTQTSLVVGFGAVALYLLIGTVLGLVAGYLGGWPDGVIMRGTEVILSVPTLLMVIVFVSIVGPSLWSVIAVIGLLGWPSTARLVRGQLLSLRESEFVTASRVLGARDRRIVLGHMLPNVVGSLVVVATLGIAGAILLEAGLSFLGLGVKPPASSLGQMISAAMTPSVLHGAPWIWIPPSVVIAALVVAVNLVGDGLRDVLDPRSRHR